MCASMPDAASPNAPEPDMSRLLVANIAVSSALAGLIWTIQLVHYPLMAKVGAEAFSAYHVRHTGSITGLVAPLMAAEVFLAISLVVWRPQEVPAGAAWVALGLVAVCWLSTAFIQVPLHSRLAEAFDAEAHRSLVTTNWLRTAAWTGRAALLFCWISPAPRP